MIANVTENIRWKDYRTFFQSLFIAEGALLILLLKSPILSIALSLAILVIILVLIYPEFGLSLALTSNVLAFIIFDFVHVEIVAPVLVLYALLTLGGVSIYILKYGWDSAIQFGGPIKYGFALALVMLLGLVYSQNFGYGFQKVTLYFIYNLNLLILPLFFVNDLKRLKNILLFAYLLGLVLAIYSTILAVNVPSYIRFRPSASVNPIWLARSLSVSMLAGIYILTRYKNALARIAISFSFFFFLYPVVKTMSRGPLLALIFSAFVFFLVQPYYSKKRKLMITIPAVIIAILLVTISASQVTARLQTPITEEMSAAFRILAWIRGIQDFLHSPVIGIGTGSFELRSPWVAFVYPHNLILEIASENGLLGLAILLSFIISTWKYALRSIRVNFLKLRHDVVQLNIAIFCIYVFALLNAMFSGDISLNEIVWFATGMIYAIVLNTNTLRLTNEI